MQTLGLVANVYQEANAIPGWLETHTPYFDDVRVIHAGPGGAYSTDGTIEILEKWKIPVGFCAIDDGFGVVRTQAIHMSPCDYVMLLDADERFYQLNRQMTVDGEATPQEDVDRILNSYDFHGSKYPDWGMIAGLGANLKVDIGPPYDQMANLRGIIETKRPDAVCSIRRHWHDLGFRRPTQNWLLDPDWQARIVRNSPDIYFDPATRMHERIMGLQSVHHGGMVQGPFFEHFHFAFKRMEEDQRRHDVEIYDAIHKGETPPTQKDFNVKNS